MPSPGWRCGSRLSRLPHPLRAAKATEPPAAPPSPARRYTQVIAPPAQQPLLIKYNAECQVADTAPERKRNPWRFLDAVPGPLKQPLVRYLHFRQREQRADDLSASALVDELRVR